MSEEDLKREFEYYVKNQEALLKEYKGKFIALKEQKVLGAYDTEIQAIEETQKEHELGTFLVQQCVPKTDSDLQVYHSRAVFV